MLCGDTEQIQCKYSVETTREVMLPVVRLQDLFYRKYLL